MIHSRSLLLGTNTAGVWGLAPTLPLATDPEGRLT